MSDLGPHFQHLYRVAKEALAHGDRRPAEALMRSYRKEVDLLEKYPGKHAQARGIRGTRLRATRDKVRRIAQLIADAPTGIEALPQGFDPPSPFACAHIRRTRDPIANMKLTSTQAAAAREIRTIFEHTVRSLTPWSRDLDSIRVDSSVGPSDPWYALPDNIAERRARVYMPWARDNRCLIAERRVGALQVDRLTRVGLVLAVLIDRVPLGVLERRFGIASKGTLGKIFRQALDDYASLARTVPASK